MSTLRRELHVPVKRWALALAVLSLAVAACGGGSAENDFANLAAEATASTDGSNPDSSGTSDEISVDGIDLPDGLPTADGLIPELEGLPVPAGAVFGVGDAFDADVDPRETAVQQVYFAIPVEEVVAFYLDELPAAGYEIVSGTGGAISEKSEIVADQPALVMFTRPDGLPGQLLIGPSNVAVSQLNINVYRSGVR